jgi:hypothetical protein
VMTVIITITALDLKIFGTQFAASARVVDGEPSFTTWRSR